MVFSNKPTDVIKKTNITRDDILNMSDYEQIRDKRRAEIAKIKKNRRLAVGPHASFYFECYQTMWYQIHEMLRIEKGGEGQIQDEIKVYNSLIPKGTELVATVMFEIPDAQARAKILADLGGVEQTIKMEIGKETIYAKPEDDVDRTSSAGKTSSVHFIHFLMNPIQVNAFKRSDTRVVIGIDHPNYGHMAVLPDYIKRELSDDLE